MRDPDRSLRHGFSLRDDVDIDVLVMVVVALFMVLADRYCKSYSWDKDN